MKRKCLAKENCPVARGYDAIGDWWSLLIVLHVLNYGTRRFSQLQEALGMAKNILTARLKKLVQEGILQKCPCHEGSAYHQYSPTERGRDLYKVLIALRQWGEKYYGSGCEDAPQLVDRATKQPIPELQVRAADGRVLGAGDLVVVDRAGNEMDVRESVGTTK
jgi:DNA-binding HxlR family transcriptional regulator